MKPYSGDARIALEAYDDGLDSLSCHLPWDFYAEEGVVQLQEDHALMGIIEYACSDQGSQDPQEVITAKDAVANVLFPYQGGFTFQFETSKRLITHYPDSAGVHPVAELVDRERRDMLTRGTRQYRVRHFMTVTYRRSERGKERIASFFDDRPEGERKRDYYRDEVIPFRDRLHQIAGELGRAIGAARVLNTEQVQAHLATCLDVEQHDYVAVPDTPFWPIKSNLITKGLMPGSPMELTNGLEGDRWTLKVLGILGFPPASHPSFLADLLGIDAEFRWVVRMEMMDPVKAISVFQALLRKYEDSSYDIRSIVTYPFTKQTKQTAAGALHALEAQEARIETEAAGKSSGWMTAVFVTWAPTLDPDGRRSEAPEMAAKQAREVFRRAGCLTVDEGWGAEHAWYATMPGHVRPGARKVPVAQTIMSDWPVLSTPWPGPLPSPGRKGGELLLLESPGGYPLRVDPWLGQDSATIEQAQVDGAVLMVGDPRAGKSTFQSFAGSQHLARNPDARVVCLDVDSQESTSFVATLAHGGQYLHFGGGGGLSLQPFVDCDTEEGLEWGIGFALSLLETQDVIGGGSEQVPRADAGDMVQAALKLLALGPPEERTITMLYRLIQNKRLRTALSIFRRGEAEGHLMDCETDRLADSPWITVDIGSVLDHEYSAVILRALFRRFYRLFEEQPKPTLFLVGEGRRMIRDCPKELEDIRRRGPKKKVTLFLETHQIEDIEGNRVTGLLKNIPTIIALHSARATHGSQFQDMRFNWREADQVAGATDRRDVFVKTRLGSRMGQLNLGPVALALCGCGASDRAAAMRIHRQYGPAGFAAAWLRHKGLFEQAAIIGGEEFYAQAAE